MGLFDEAVGGDGVRRGDGLQEGGVVTGPQGNVGPLSAGESGNDAAEQAPLVPL